MNDLHEHLRDYLRLRRALGYQLVFPGRVLPQFLTFLAEAGATSVSTEHALAWALLPSNVQRIHHAHRLSAVRGFASYLQTIDPLTQVPPRDVLPARQQRCVPYLWSPAEVSALLQAAHQLQPGRRAATCATVLGLLAVTGLRIGEALALTEADIDLDQGILTVVGGKSTRTRLIPLAPSTTAALQEYQDRRREWWPSSSSSSPSFFVTSTGTALTANVLRATFTQLTTDLGLRTATVKPRIHDLRH